jgi:hypothetical protein
MKISNKKIRKMKNSKKNIRKKKILNKKLNVNNNIFIYKSFGNY